MCCNVTQHGSGEAQDEKGGEVMTPCKRCEHTDCQEERAKRSAPNPPSPQDEQAGAAEKAIAEIIYATACRYEGHESQCNIYGCTRHDHPEVKAVRREIVRLQQAARDEGLEMAAKVAAETGPIDSVADSQAEGWNAAVTACVEAIRALSQGKER